MWTLIHSFTHPSSQFSIFVFELGWDFGLQLGMTTAHLPHAHTQYSTLMLYVKCNFVQYDNLCSHLHLLSPTAIHITYQLDSKFRFRFQFGPLTKIFNSEKTQTHLSSINFYSQVSSQQTIADGWVTDAEGNKTSQTKPKY